MRGGNSSVFGDLILISLMRDDPANIFYVIMNIMCIGMILSFLRYIAFGRNSLFSILVNNFNTKCHYNNLSKKITII